MYRGQVSGVGAFGIPILEPWGFGLRRTTQGCLEQAARLSFILRSCFSSFVAERSWASARPTFVLDRRPLSYSKTSRFEQEPPAPDPAGQRLM